MDTFDVLRTNTRVDIGQSEETWENAVGWGFLKRNAYDNARRLSWQLGEAWRQIDVVRFYENYYAVPDDLLQMPMMRQYVPQVERAVAVRYAVREYGADGSGAVWGVTDAASILPDPGDAPACAMLAEEMVRNGLAAASRAWRANVEECREAMRMDGSADKVAAYIAEHSVVLVLPSPELPFDNATLQALRDEGRLSEPGGRWTPANLADTPHWAGAADLAERLGVPYGSR